MARKKRKTKAESKAEVKTTIRLVESDESNPRITAEPGTKIEVIGVELVSGKTQKPLKMAARLCGGTSTCLALVRTE
ncbi:hypothetical protein Poly51_62360 [Rubripirellula tenax]|uniref:Uncharacterized protein n=1 Tax=Rubripirellula tenax TaxID=2528015 RepID=A0A5C6E6S2_9BACT|nr:hypothetical protein [Rubripirellula tenax]TWU43657.1 hypothetical protein Poly51_62360 [Rubripirellula tenax]